MMTLVQQAATELLRRRLARRSFLEFLKYVWWMPHPLIIGKHTRAICELVDTAIADYLIGKSSFLDITVPFRHGKSDLVSRALPPYFLGRCADKDPDVIMSGYGGELVAGFSKDAKSIIRSIPYHRVFPGIELKVGSDNINEWQLAGRYGKVTATGLGGALTGKGYHLGIIDDYCKSRAEAESQTYRDNTWDAFCNDFMTRRAPQSITILCATSWHIDDVRGRAHQHEKDDEHFPQFRKVHFGAKNPDGTFLFTERYPDDWYKSQYATLGMYAAAGLLDGKPITSGGGVVKREWFKVIEIPPTGGVDVRAWDCAATAKKSADYTAGARIRKIGSNYYILDISYGQIAASHVMQHIRNIAEMDGKETRIGFEEEGGSSGKIVTSQLVQILAGFPVIPIRPSGDKLTRALPLFAQVQAGNVYIVRGDWNKYFLDELMSFPDGVHDDTVDAAAHAFNLHHSGPKVGVW